MSGVTRVPIDPPHRPRGNRFPMTALADAMFQLLIFFMLASSLTPYSLLPLQRTITFATFRLRYRYYITGQA